MRKPAKVYPSILAADFGRLAAEVAAIEDVVDGLHVDLMDGHFVPNLSLGIPVIESLRRSTSLYFDTHLMMNNPDVFFGDLKKAGSSMVSVHIEVFPDPTGVCEKARGAGLDFGLVLNPATPFEAVAPFLELCDQLLVMSVEPGFGGQAFMPEVLPKISAAREMIDSRGLTTDIEVDGGITPGTAPLARQAGADVFAAGTVIFRASDPVAAVRELRAAIEK